MLGLFSGIKNVVPLGKKVGAAKTEGAISVLHYRATTIIFLSCCILVTSLEWIGNGAAITCAMVGPDDSWTIPKDVINSYCYIQSTFLVPGVPGGVTAHPGVGPGAGSRSSGTQDQKHKAYYQWVSFMLFLQAGMFYFPHLLFKNWEGGKVSNILSGLHRVVLDKADRHSREKLLARYLRDNLNNHNLWGIRLYLVRFIYLINLVGNIVLIDVFLDWEFSTYGLKVVELMEDDPIGRMDPMSRIFPKVTKCTMRKFGPSGSIQNHDAICVLPINIINEKIYVVLWFWLLFLCVLTLLSLIYNTFVLVTPPLRNMLLRSRGPQGQGTSTKLEEISRHLQVGDWMLLYQLSRNMESIVWGELVSELHILIKDANHNSDSSLDKQRHHSRQSHSSRAKTPITSM